MAAIEGWQGAIQRWQNAAQEAKSAVLKGFDQYCKLLVTYAKKNKLSGQVLNKRTGYLRNNVKSIASGELERTFTAPFYGVAWENGFHRNAYPVFPVNAKALSWIGAGGKRFFSRGHVIPAGDFPARPWFKPSYDETQRQLVNWVAKPFAAIVAGGQPGSDFLINYGRRD